MTNERDKMLEFLRSFIAGGVNQDFKPWASELYAKLYGAPSEIEQLHAAVKTAQELAATRLMEIERLQKREKDLMGVIDSRDRALGFVPLDEVHASEPCEQHGPFAGLQSLSFDVSENPTIALVMRFDNIEHAQAARDQLWQPAGAARDASSGERWPKSIAGEAPWCKCPDGDCAGWDEAINHGCCCRVANGR